MIINAYNKELDAAIYTIEGDVEYTEIRDAIDNYYRGMITKYTIWDYSKASPGKHLTGDDTRKIGLQVHALGKARPDGVDLIVVPGIVQYGIARIYYGYADMLSASKLKTHIYRNMKDALEFIRKNETLLTKEQLMKTNQNGQAIIGILISLAIVALLYFVVAKKYLTNPMDQDKDAKKALAGQGIVVNNLPDAENRAREAVEKANKANKEIEAQNAPPAE